MNTDELRLLEKEVGYHLDRVKALITIAVMRDGAPTQFGYRGISPLPNGDRALQFFFQCRQGHDRLPYEFDDFYRAMDKSFGFGK